MSAEDPYSAADKLLHRIALGSAAVAEMSFDLEQAFARPDASMAKEGRHVFVCGLARAGTTLIMRGLHDTGMFRSLTYRDMPFVLMPGLWARISRAFRKQGDARTRAHGDALTVSFDSPEAFEEVFWRVFHGAVYLKPDRLVPMELGPEDREPFRRYIAAILRDVPTRARYLSKNNNNILRLPGIIECFPNATIIVPYRDPLRQARSLLNQHHRFCAPERDTPFTRAYMGWLGHHEFGPGHRPFRFRGGTEETRSRHIDPSTLDYWLERWTDCYAYVLERATTLPAGQIVFVSYERLLAAPELVANGLARRLDLPTGSLFTGDTIVASEARDTPDDIDNGTIARAAEIHEALIEMDQY